MCEKCVDIDKRILHLQGLATRVLDQQVVDGIEKLIAELAGRKIALHPDQKQ